MCLILVFTQEKLWLGGSCVGLSPSKYRLNSSCHQWESFFHSLLVGWQEGHPVRKNLTLAILEGITLGDLWATQPSLE